MALGGGTFTIMNKKLPGSYINVVSTATANATLSDRGIVALAVGLQYSPGGVFEVTSDILNKDSLKLFCCDAGDDGLKRIREVLMNARKVYVYNTNDNGTKASNTYATAKYAGAYGNNIKISIVEDIDNTSNYVVSTLIGNTVADKQSVSKTGKTDALAANDFVDWKANVALAATASTSMTGGASASGVGAVSTQNALNAFEKYTFNVLCIGSSSSTINNMAVSYTKRLRDETGKKFQCVVYNANGTNGDHEGIVKVATRSNEGDYNMVYWVAGALAGCPLNRSLTNRIYDGEYKPVVNETQAQLEGYIDGGIFAFHKVGDDVRVLTDINSLTSFTEEKGDIFQSNQTVRVADQIANDIATIFNTKYIGAVQNNESGRALFKAEIVSHHQELQAMNAIEGFSSDDVTIAQGDEKGTVVVTDAVTITGAMTKLYMTVYVN